jgi:hypothetical protein
MQFLDNSGNSVFLGGNNGDFLVQTPSGGFSTKLTITNSGAATFSSSVTTTFLNIGSSNGQMGSINSSNANGGYITWETSGVTIADIGTSQQIFGAGGNDTFGINARGARNLVFGSNNTERMRITSGGNVGIGTTNPAERLSVNGNIEIQGIAGTTRYIITNETNTGTGRLVIQAGGGSAAFGGALNLYANAHPTYSGDVAIGLSANSTSKFRVNSSGLDGATDLFTVLRSSGNVLIGTTTDAGFRLDVNGSQAIRAMSGAALSLIGNETLNSPWGITWRTGTYSGGVAAIRVSRIGASDASNMMFFTSPNGDIPNERMRITSGGFTKHSNTGAYVTSTGLLHEFNTNQNDTNLIIRNSSGTLSNPRAGVEVSYSAASPNNTVASFFQANDSTTARFEVRSNGGIANYQANNVNLSDERTKKDIIPLDSYWDKFKQIEIVKFKYKDQTHDDFNIGVIAQQVESIAPEFIDVDGWYVKPDLDEEGNEIISEEEPLKSVYTADLYHATIKVLQEAMAKIEELTARLEILENK